LLIKHNVKRVTHNKVEIRKLGKSLHGIALNGRKRPKERSLLSSVELLALMVQIVFVNAKMVNVGNIVKNRDNYA
jgi:hypothetical protein